MARTIEKTLTRIWCFNLFSSRIFCFIIRPNYEKIMYKDENAENQYIVQFNDSYPDKTFEVHFDSIILNSDKFGIGSEIAVR